MFRSARLKLTGWYLLILMIVSGLFSVAIYNGVSREIDRAVVMQKVRWERVPGTPFVVTPQIDPDLISEARTRIAVFLVSVNAVILLVSALLSYFLAGRTLKPIEEIVEEQRRFVSDASHELRTPLTALKTSLEVNLRDKKTTKNEKTLLTSYLAKINSLQILTNNLLHLSHYDADKNGYHSNPVKLNEVIQGAFRKVEELAKQKHIQFHFEDLHKKLEADPLRLEELFMILFDNAIKYSPEKANVSVTAKQTDSSVLIHVADTGIGIAPSDLPHLFDRFYRAEKSRTKATHEGYGLGLAIAQRIVALHKGSITVKSTVGKGTVFTIQLPLKHS